MSSRTSAARLFGFRRVERVRIITSADRTIAEVTGVVHRYPRTIRVPLRTATRLVAAGLPVTVESLNDGQVGVTTANADVRLRLPPRD